MEKKFLTKSTITLLTLLFVLASAASCKFVVYTKEPLQITTATIESAKVGNVYNQTLTTNSKNAASWSISDGALPTGLTLSDNGIISGTPTNSGSFIFSVTAHTDDDSDTKSYTLTVAENYTPSIKGVLNGHTYELYDISVTWEDAKKYCEANRGHLVVITSKEEQQFVQKLFPCEKKLYWIGLSNESGSWSWINGEELSYTNWAKNEPTEGNEHWAQMYSENHNAYLEGEWNDNLNTGDSTKEYYSLDNTGFICEYDTVASDVTQGIFVNNDYDAGYVSSANLFTYNYIEEEALRRQIKKETPSASKAEPLP